MNSAGGGQDAVQVKKGCTVRIPVHEPKPRPRQRRAGKSEVAKCVPLQVLIDAVEGQHTLGEPDAADTSQDVINQGMVMVYSWLVHGSPVRRTERRTRSSRPSNLIWVMPAKGDLWGPMAGSSRALWFGGHMSNQTTTDLTRPVAAAGLGWRVVDIVVAAVLGVAVGLIFLIWNTVGYAWFQAMDAATPGVGGLAAGIWFLGGPLGGLIIRKPGAALFVELLAAIVSALIGNVWGVSTLYSGLAQGIGAEIVFAIFAYRNWKLPVAVLSGALAGVGAWTLELFITPNLPKGVGFNVIYLACTAVSGAILAGAFGWLLTRALARTGVLNRFASGRTQDA